MSGTQGEGGADAARLVARDDLVARLDGAVARKVTVVSAPAGSGKTSLLRAWAAGPGRAHRRAAEWFTGHGRVVDAVRHTQAAGDWPGAARLLADHCVSLTLDGRAQTVAALVRAFPPGAAADPELALVRDQRAGPGTARPRPATPLSRPRAGAAFGRLTGYRVTWHQRPPG